MSGTTVTESYTAADALIDGLVDCGVSHLFANFGSDHPPLIESLAKSRRRGRNQPRVVLCPHESVALSAAHGHALISGQGQGVLVHCDVGTQTLGGAVHNICRARVPAFIFAGETSVTIDGELPGTRNRPVQFIQDVADQHSIVRPYMKWSYAMRTGVNAKQLAYRGMQLAQSAPRGPVYLSSPRELLEQPASTNADDVQRWPIAAPSALGRQALDALAARLETAKRPVLVTSYLGRAPEAVELLVMLSERFALGVVEASPAYLNFPSNHPAHLGDEAEPCLADADLVIVMDCDVPWLPTIATPRDEAAVFHIDLDPLKQDLPLWHAAATVVCQADSLEVLRQIEAKTRTVALNESVRQERLAWHAGLIGARSTPPPLTGHDLTADWLSYCLNTMLADDAIVLDETITSSPALRRHLVRTQPGTYFQSGGSSLGWHGGAAIGAKLAAPDKPVVALVGDGTYLFSVPSAVHWVARRYQTPFLTVIYNNRGWNATKQNLLKLHPTGAAASTDHFWVNLDNASDLPGIAVAAGAGFGRTVETADEVMPALEAAFDALRRGESAVIDVRLPAISAQRD